MIGVGLVAALTARIVVGDWQLTDALIPVAMLALFPFFEWVVHVFVLHWRPRRLGPVTIDSLLARKHREHHVDPRDVPLIFIPWRALLWVLPLSVAVAVLAFPRTGLGLTYLVFLAVLGLGYEWCHYLIHSDYKPRTVSVPGDLEEPPAASLQERALLVHGDELRDRRPRARHLSRRGSGRHLTDGEESPRRYAWMMMGSPTLTVS